MATTRFGIIGCGGIARRGFLPALAKCGGAALAAIASRSADTAADLGARHDCAPVIGYEALLERDDVDAVYIATPNSEHARWAIAAARHGKHVLCEKPLVTSAGEAEQVVAACAAGGVALLEGFMYRFHGQHDAVRRAVRDGEVGEPFAFHAWFGFPTPAPDNVRLRADLGGGALLDAGAYTVHSARHFFGREPERVHAVLDRRGGEVDLRGAALLDFGDGRVAHLAFGFDNFYRNSYAVWGSRGQVTLTRAYACPPDHAPGLILEQQDHREERDLPPCDHFAREIEAFCEGIPDAARRTAWREEALAQATAMQRVREAAGRP